MSVKNSRITINLEAPDLGILTSLAKIDSVTIESFVKKLVLEELERREDEALCSFVQARELKDKDTPRVSHEDAWK